MKIDDYIEKLEGMCEGNDMPWHFKIDDPSGNSFVQNPHAPANDVYVKTKNYERSHQELADMGFVDPDAAPAEEGKDSKEEAKDSSNTPAVKKPDFTNEEIDMMMKKAREVDAKKEERKYEEEEVHDNFNNEVFRIPMP